MEKMYYSCAILHLLLLVMRFAICTSLATNTTSFGCISGERNALLKLKASFEDPFNRLSSWHNNTDCCTWKGVLCDSNAGRVVGLRLRNTDPFSKRGYENWLASNQLDSSLLELKYLSYLDLSWNDFQLSPIPAFIGSMKQLQHLNLSKANFSGVVPHNLGNLSNLRVVDLRSTTTFPLVDDLMWASNLSMLEHLDMAGVDMSRAKHLSEVLFHMLPSILFLRLFNTQLTNTHFPNSCVNSSLLTNIQHLDLRYNSFDGEFPCFLHNMTSLRVLDLSANYYNSSNPHVLLRLRNLDHLDLSNNSLHHKTDWISEFLLDKCHLKSLSLAHNNFYGELSGRLFRNLSMGYCWTQKLEILDLGHNQFNGHLPQEISELKQLNLLDLTNNAFTGPIPTSFGKLRALRYLLLNNNHQSGEVPISLGQLSDLEMIDISYNSFNGTLSELHFAKLLKLEVLRAESINLSVERDWVPPFQLKELHLESCEIGTQFPQWLQTQKALEKLSFLNCSILGSLPEWFHYLNLTFIDMSHNMIHGSISNLPPYSRYLDLSHNMINGSIPNLPPYLAYLDLSDNMFNGVIPKLPPSLIELHLSHNMINGSIPNIPPYLIELDLSHNHIEGPIPKFCSNLFSLSSLDSMMDGSIPDSLCQLEDLDLSRYHFSGNIPNCQAPNLQRLNYLRLSSNNLSGVIPSSLGECRSLEVLLLNNNSLTGELPGTLRNCTFLGILDVGDNQLTGNLSDWIGPLGWESFSGLQFLRLRNNEFYGEIPSAFCQLDELQILDLANNKLTGTIPNCFGNFSGMGNGYICVSGVIYWKDVTLNQVLKGMNQDYTTTLCYVVNLDLSNNNLVGEIPPQLTNLSALIGLNLSHNQLGGKILDKIGDMKKLESLDLASNKLCGTIPESLSGLTFLTSLNLSHNNLSGRIPTGNQLQTLENPISIYGGNPGLCGDPLPKRCPDNRASKFPNVDEDEGAEDEDDRNKKIIFYGIIASGFATGFWGIIGALVLRRSWGLAFSKFAEVAIGKILGL